MFRPPSMQMDRFVPWNEDMEEFTQMIHVLTAEPNVPLLGMN